MTCPRDDTRRRTVTHGEDAPSSYGAESQTATTPVAVESRVSTGMLPGSNLVSPLCSSGEETALVYLTACITALLNTAALNAVINPDACGADSTLLCGSPFAPPPTPARPSPPSHGPPQGTAATAAQHLAVLGGGPSQTTGLSHLRPTSGLASQSTPRAHTLAGRHSRSAPAPILFRRPRLFSSDACGALHLVEGKAPVLRVLTGRAGRVAAGQVALDLVLR